MSGCVELPASVRKRFYEPVVLLDALRSVYLRDNRISEPDLETAAGKSSKQTYYGFLNKLSQICDSEPKQPLGKTVTAIVVLDSGTIEYRLASNQRSNGELESVKTYLKAILDLLAQATDDELNDKAFTARLFTEILLAVLAFNRSRIENYVDALLAHGRLDFCIDASAKDGTSEGTLVSKALGDLLPHVRAAGEAPQTDNNMFARHAAALLHTIHSHHEPCLEEYMRNKTRSNSAVGDSPWGEVRHALGRLLSYHIAIKVLTSARKTWPQLFSIFEVTSIPSSLPSDKPPDIRRTAKGMIQRMSRNKALLAEYQLHAAELQSHGLDERIRQRTSAARFRPIVHAEVHLLASVLRDQALSLTDDGDDGDDGPPLRFFNEASFGRYVGTSKPTCLLCHMYFAAHPAGARCRETHGNLYYNWRAPDVLMLEGGSGGGGSGGGGGGGGEQEQKLEIMEAMIKEVRNETGRAIKERSYPRRRHDSRDTPSNPLWSTTRGGSTVLGGDGDGDDSGLATGLEDVSLDAASTAGLVEGMASREGNFGAHAFDDDAEEEDGGARL